MLVGNARCVPLQLCIAKIWQEMSDFVNPEQNICRLDQASTFVPIFVDHCTKKANPFIRWGWMSIDSLLRECDVLRMFCEPEMHGQSAGQICLVNAYKCSLLPPASVNSHAGIVREIISVTDEVVKERNFQRDVRNVVAACAFMPLNCFGTGTFRIEDPDDVFEHDIWQQAEYHKAFDTLNHFGEIVHSV